MKLGCPHPWVVSVAWVPLQCSGWSTVCSAVGGFFYFSLLYPAEKLSTVDQILSLLKIPGMWTIDISGAGIPQLRVFAFWSF